MNPYDEVPYQGGAYPQTNPERLATIATLFGMRPPPIEKCRVLEIGTADGSNLIPLSYIYPNSEFLGIDLSASQVATGNAIIRELGLKNIQLEALDIAELRNNTGVFDYIICHGVFSWVPRLIQDAIFDVCARLLTPNGIAYISYNTYPGWSFRGVARDIMCFHAGPFKRAEDKIEQACAMLRFVAESVTDARKS
jgi:SAM-dependent methyltransferase